MVEKKEVVVVGAGIGGAAFVGKLLKNKLKVNVTVIERRQASFVNYAGLRAATLGNDFSHRVTVPNNKLVPPTAGKIIHASVTEIDVENQLVKLDREVAEVRYDYLVLATGSKNNSPAEFPDEVTSFKAMQEYYQRTHEKIISANNIAILGAGAVGCELAGEIKDAYPKKGVTIVGQGETVLAATKPPLPKKTITRLTKKLKEMGVTLHLDQSIKDLSLNEFDSDNTKTTSGELETTKGEKFEADLVIKAIGAAVRTEIYPASWKNDRERVRVNNFFQVKQDDQVLDNVFAIGDINDLKQPNQGYLAKNHGELLANNLKKALSGKKLVAYKAEGPTMMVIPLGRKKGEGYFGMHMGNKLAPMIKGKDLFVPANWAAYNMKKELLKENDPEWKEKTKQW